MSNILALDQSSHITGYAVFTKEGRLKSYGKFDFDSSNFGKRLFDLRTEIQQIINENEISEIIAEDIQMQNNNVTVYKALAQVLGVIQELAYENNLEFSTVVASSWKSTLSIKGKTRPEQKRNAQQYIIDTFKIKPTQDECDAICIGLHHFKTKAFDWSK